jgi:hypothetical protein
VAIGILLSKFLSPITMDDDKISSSEYEFDFLLLNDEIMSIHKALDDKVNESSDEDSDEVRDVRRRKIKNNRQ